VNDAEARRFYEDLNAGLRPANDAPFLFSVPAGGAQTIPVGLATEAASALSASPVKTINVDVGLAAESDSALTVTSAAGAVAVGLAAEADTALGVTPVKVIYEAVGLASESDSALVLVGQEPAVPQDTGYKGGGRVLHKGEFPEWWKDWEEPQPEEEIPKSAKEQLAELAAGLPARKPKVVPIRPQLKPSILRNVGLVIETNSALPITVKRRLRASVRAHRRMLAASLLLHLESK
jgi:hypothetical protein